MVCQQAIVTKKAAIILLFLVFFGSWGVAQSSDSGAQFQIYFAYIGKNMYELKIHTFALSNRAYEISYLAAGTDVQGKKIVYTTTVQRDALVRFNLAGLMAENIQIKVCDNSNLCQEAVEEARDNPTIISGMNLYLLIGGIVLAAWFVIGHH